MEKMEGRAGREQQKRVRRSQLAKESIYQLEGQQDTIVSQAMERAELLEEANSMPKNREMMIQIESPHTQERQRKTESDKLKYNFSSFNQ